MIVIINGDHQVKADNYVNYTLFKAVRDESGAIKIGKDKTIEQRTIGYYSNMRQALNMKHTTTLDCYRS